MKFYALLCFPLCLLGGCYIEEHNDNKKPYDPFEDGCDDSTGGSKYATGGNGSAAGGNGSATGGNGSDVGGTGASTGGDGSTTGGSSGTAGTGGYEPPPPPPPPSCIDLDDEIACSDRSDCTPVYAGTDCTCGPDCTCVGGEPGCVCENYGFLVCVDSPSDGGAGGAAP